MMRPSRELHMGRIIRDSDIEAMEQIEANSL
jgi:hypothetical protein